MWSRFKAPIGGLGEEVPLKLKLFAHLHIIFSHHTAKNWGMSGHRRHQWIDATAEGLGAVPPAGSRGRAPVQGVDWGVKTPEVESFAKVADFCLIRRFFLGDIRLWGDTLQMPD